MSNHWLFRKAKMPVLTKAISQNISILNNIFFYLLLCRLPKLRLLIK